MQHVIAEQRKVSKGSELNHLTQVKHPETDLSPRHFNETLLSFANRFLMFSVVVIFFVSLS
jgi:hypothetical protein